MRPLLCLFLIPLSVLGFQYQAETQAEPEKIPESPKVLNEIPIAYEESVPSHCDDYDNAERGVAHPINQDEFNHLDARGYARRRLACLYNGGTNQWECLDDLWGRLESGWNHYADNPRSSAYGIPQALPGSKMGPGWQTDPRVQIRWGLEYIRTNREFHTPCEAKTYRLRRGSY